jgi:hypothetical protein
MKEGTMSEEKNRSDLSPNDLLGESEAAQYLGISAQWLRCS